MRQQLGLLAQFLEDVTGRPFYTDSGIHNKQFVGRVPLSLGEFEQELHDMGFERNPLSSWKTLGETNESEEASWRKVGYDNFPDYQLHLIVYDGDKIGRANSGHVYLYAHWELRWDKHPWRHYRSVNESGPEGVRRMKDILDANGIVYELIRP